MNDTRRNATPSGTRNPYRPTAVAVMTEESTDVVTVDTAAIRQTQQHLGAYLENSRDAEAEASTRPVSGNILAVVGEYGTGKTHLLRNLVHRFSDPSRPHSHVVYLEAAGRPSFLEIYREFIRQLQERHDLVERVRDYYVDLAVADLGRTPLLEPYAEQLRRGATIGDVEKAFGLAVPELMNALRAQLARITDSPVFGLALPLLLNPELEPLVSAWLRGDEPDLRLVERGIGEAIATEEQALEAIGVFALVYGRHQHRLMVVIDEIDRLLPQTGAEGAVAEGAFKKLLQVIADSGGFLVVAGLSDFLRVLRPDTRQRIGTVVQMPGWSRTQVEEYVLAVHERFLGERTIAPFTAEALRQVAQVTAGVPRQVIRLLRESFDAATEDGVQVTPDVVLGTAPDLAAADREEVRQTVAEALSVAAIPYEMNRRASLLPKSVVDFWLPFPGPDNGCGIIVTGSVLTEEDLHALTEAAKAIRAHRDGVVARLVVVGWLTPRYHEALERAFDAAPLAYHRRTFEMDLRAAVGVAMARYSDDLTPLQDQVRAVARQQRDIDHTLDRLLDAFQDLRRSTEHAFAEPSRQWGTGSRTDPPADRPLPDTVASLFAEARDTIEGVDRLRLGLHGVFDLTARSAQERSEEHLGWIAEMRRIIGCEESIASHGLLSVLAALVDAFEGTVASWYARWVTAQGRDDEGTAHRSLVEICRAYDDIFAALPLHLLSGVDLLSRLSTMPTQAASTRVPATSPQQRRQDLSSVLTDLAVKTRRSLLDAF